MSIDKRPRGRPRGSGKNDTHQLRQVAELLIRDPSLKPTTAMKRILRSRSGWGATDETLLRRWQIKWKENGAQFLAIERDCAQAQQLAPSARSFVQRLAEIQNSPEMRRWQEMMRGIQNSPEFKRWQEVARAIQESPVLKRWQGVANAIQESPQLRARQALQNSPTWKVMPDIKPLPRLDG
jgi:L-rhamnose mutarotase